jgi:hypothetical protein
VVATEEKLHRISIWRELRGKTWDEMADVFLDETRSPAFADSAGHGYIHSRVAASSTRSSSRKKRDRS